MDSFLDRVHDPLLFLNTDKSDLDAFLMNTSADMAHMAEEMHINVSDVKLENSLDLDSLEGNGHLGDMNWLHNSSLSTLAHLDNDDTSDSTNIIAVNPQSILPVEITHNENTDNHLLFDSENGLSLHDDSSTNHDPVDTETPHSLQQQSSLSKSQNVVRQEHQTIRILSVQGASLGSQSKTQNFLITSSKDSPHKGQTFVLSAVDGTFPSGLTISADLPVHTNASGSQFVLASPQEMNTKTDKSNRVVLKSGHNLLSPSQSSPVLLGRLQTGTQPQVYQQVYLTCTVPSTTAAPLQQSEHATVSSTTNNEEKIYPKPVFSYSCLIALALKNSKNGSLPVSEIYNFMCENFPYFKTAPDGWKNSVRHNLSLNKCFAKVDNPKMSQGAKKGCLWALNPAKILKMEDEISKWSKKDPVGLLSSMAYPENLEAIEKGQAGLHYSKKSPDCSPCTLIQTEATSSKTPELTHEQKPDVSQIRVEKYHPNICLEKTEVKNSIKIELPSDDCRDSSPTVKQELPSPSLRSETFFKTEPTDYSCSENPGSFTSDALTDIILQNSVWDDDLENNIDIDLICNSSSSCLPSPSTHSPVMFRLSPNKVFLQNSSGSKKSI